MGADPGKVARLPLVKQVVFDENIQVTTLPDVPEMVDVQVNPLTLNLHSSFPRDKKKFSKLLLPLHIYFADGTHKKIHALVDTGAEVNLIKRSLVDSRFFSPSAHPVRLGAANSTRLDGGTQEVSLRLNMEALEISRRTTINLSVPMFAYDADIKHDMIISFGWLVEHDVTINPRRMGLLFQHGPERDKWWVQGLKKTCQK